MDAIIQKSEEVAKEHLVSKLSPAILKNALMNLESSYSFMKDTLDDVEDAILSGSLTKSKSSQSKMKKSKS